MAFRGVRYRSPDGATLAVVSTRDGDRDLYVMNADGTNVLQLTHNDAFDWPTAWSPDGTRIALASDGDGDNEVHVAVIEGL